MRCIIILILFSMVALSAILNSRVFADACSIMIEERHTTCTVDTECISVNETCGCGCGVAVNKAFVDYYDVMRKNKCEGTFCEYCEMYCPKITFKCIEDRCLRIQQGPDS